MASFIKCIYCGRDNFASQKGLKQHQSSNKTCFSRLKGTLKLDPKSAPLPTNSMQFIPVAQVKISSSLIKFTQSFTNFDQNWVGHPENITPTSRQKRSIDNISHSEREEEVDVMNNFDLIWTKTNLNEPSIVVNTPVIASTTPNPEPVSNKLCSSFQKHVAYYLTKHEFTTNEKNAINLIHTLRQSSASLGMYDSLMHWHLVANGDICSHQWVQESSNFINQKKIFKLLHNHYNFENGFHHKAEMILPYSKAKTKIIWNDAKACMILLLTNPRITDEDYLFLMMTHVRPPTPQMISKT